MSRSKLQQGWLRFGVFLWLWLRTQQDVLAANTTVLDTDLSISYQPLQNWHPSTDLCSLCLVPTTSGTYHEAIRWSGPADPDDNAPSSSSSPPSSPQATAQSPPAQGSSQPVSPEPPASSVNVAAAANPTTAVTNSSGDNDGDGGHDSDEDPKSGKHKRRSLFGRSRFLVPRDPDDSGLTDAPMSLSFNFTGTAVYLFAFQPLATATAQGPPTNQDLTFVLDVSSPQVVQTQGTPGGTGFSNKMLFSATNLTNGLHQLVVNVGENSIFLFDRILFTPLEADAPANGTSPSSSTPLAASAPSQTNSASRKHNIATFAGAVGGSVGVLGLFSLCLAISIIRRRQLAAKRDRLDRESLHTNASDDSPNMLGPAPFVPRFFPDTVIPSEPPAYLDAVQTNQNSSTLLTRLGQSAYPASRSYADIPPDTPPPLDDLVLVPPPPFPGAAISSIPTPPHSEVDEPSIPPGGDVVSSHNRDSVGITSPVSTVPPELVPLLQSADDHVEAERPQSRLSTHSSTSRRHDPVGDPPTISSSAAS